MAIRIRFTDSGRTEAKSTTLKATAKAVAAELLIALGETDKVVADCGDAALFAASTQIVLKNAAGTAVAWLHNQAQQTAELTLKPIAIGSEGEDGSGTISARTWKCDPTSFATGTVEVYVRGVASEAVTEVKMDSGNYWVKDLRGRGAYMCSLPFIVEDV